jgi:RimJ/RimL family protein N-acetyltransferase
LKAVELVRKLGAPEILLSPLGSEYLDSYIEMLTHPETRRLTKSKSEPSPSQAIAWLQALPLAGQRKDWAILDDVGHFFGEVILADFDDTKNQIGLRVTIRRKPYFSKTVMRQAVVAALEYAFDTLAIDQVVVAVDSDNDLAISVFSSLGFAKGRSFKDRGRTWLRMSIHRWQLFHALCLYGMEKHLDVSQWRFSFDNAKRRAGICNYGEKRISISRYLIESHTLDAGLQTLAHEIAHALCGSNAAHGAVWLATAKSMGYRDEKFSGVEIARERAPWVGTCPAGHDHFRYRKPTRELACGLCSRSYSPEFRITWRKAD